MKKLIAMILMIVLCSAGLSACMGKKNPSVSSNNKAVASDENDSDSGSDQTSDSSSGKTEKDDLSIAQDCLWKALDKMVKKGDLPSFEKRELLFHGEIFTSEEAEERYSKPFSLVGKKVILGQSSHLVKNDADKPSISEYFPTYTTADVLPRLCKPSSFADNLKQCDYFIFYDDVEYSRTENYYNGSIDKVTVATIVIVVDARKQEVIRFYNIGTDSPGMITHSPRGDGLYAEAELFIAGMLRDPEWEDFTGEELADLLNSVNNPQAYLVFDINNDNLDEVLVLCQDEESEEGEDSGQDEEPEGPRYHVFRYLPNYYTQNSCFTEEEPALEEGVVSFCHATEKTGILAEYEDSMRLYTMGGTSKVTVTSTFENGIKDKMKTEPIEWTEITEDNQVSLQG